MLSLYRGENILTVTDEKPIGTEPVPVDQMSKEGEGSDEHPMGALLESASYELEIPKRGEIRKGTIARITETDVLVDVGAKSEGVIPSRELEKLPEEQRAELTIGQEIDVYVVHSGGRNGTLILSLSRAEEELDWREAEKLLDSQELYEGIVAGYNKGGLIIKLGRLRGFVPASQVSISRRRRAQGDTPDKRWGKMVDEPIFAKVIEVDRRRNRLILSERAGAREARDTLKERLISELKPGEIRTGHVINLADFGAFVDIGGADGLVHLSEISWKRIAHPRDLLKVGQKVEVKVLGVDLDRKRISLSLRELEDDPWNNIVEQYQEGQLVEGTITKLTKFGAFASMLGTEVYDIEGLIHISELADGRIEDPREVVQEGQTLNLRIIKIDRKRRRIGLSVKRVDSSEYAEQDWQAAMQGIGDLDEEEIIIRASQEIEDFDAALEAEASERGEPEAIVEAAAEELESGTHEGDTAVVAKPEALIEETEEAEKTEAIEESASEESIEMVSEIVAAGMQKEEVNEAVALDVQEKEILEVNEALHEAEASERGESEAVVAVAAEELELGTHEGDIAIIEEPEALIEETEEAEKTEAIEEPASEESVEMVSEVVEADTQKDEVSEAVALDVQEKEILEVDEVAPVVESAEEAVGAELNEDAVVEGEVEEKPDIETDSHTADEKEIDDAEDDEIKTE
jgi:small subunit ribosomal protein S1